jgi:uroporphyrinogen decarboxylase
MPLDFGIRHEPNYEELHRALTRQGDIGRVPVMEMLVDREIVASIHGVDPATTPLDKIEEARMTRMFVDMWVSMGADALSMRPIYDLPFGSEHTADTAGISRGERSWRTADAGLIKNWDEFEQYPWPDPATDYDYSQIELAGKLMPPGMKIFGYIRGVMEPTMWTMGYNTFAFALYDDPDLVKAVSDRIAEIHLPMAETLLDMDFVAGLWGSDDMGFKTGTLASPDHLRRYIFPHHKRLAKMAHDKGKLYLLHSCGKLTDVMDDLIDNVKIDGKHSYEDAIMPVASFKRYYGHRVAVLGGIDVNVLAGGTEDDVRAYVRRVLDECGPGGGYVLGSGNSVANYVPVRNFVAMVQEGHRWRSAN